MLGRIFKYRERSEGKKYVVAEDQIPTLEGMTAKMRGGYGVGSKNNERENILDFAATKDLRITNAYFIKQKSHLMFCSGGISIRVDLLCNQLQVWKIKVISGEESSPKHRFLF